MNRDTGLSVLLVSATTAPSINGVAISTETQATALRELGCKVLILGPNHAHREGKDPDWIMRWPSITTRKHPDYPLMLPAIPYFTPKRIRRFNPNLVHGQHPFIAGHHALQYTNKRAPLVTTYHTEYLEYTKQYRPRWLPEEFCVEYIRRHVERYYQHCHLILTPSEATRQSLLGQYFLRSARIEVVPTGVPIPEEGRVQQIIAQATRGQHGIPEDAFVLMTAGRIAREKNFEFILEAFRSVREATDTIVYLMIVGDGPDRHECEAYAQKIGINSASLVWVGAVPHKRMVEYYRAADLFLWACKNDTQGLVINEAKAAGLPSLVLYGGGASESIRNGHDGIVIKKATRDEELHAFIAQILMVVHSREGLRSLIDGCLQRRELFTPQRSAKRQLELYHEILKISHP